MDVTAEHVQEGGFLLRATLNSFVTAPVKYAVVEADVATGVLGAATDPRRAILCALALCIDDSDTSMWPEGSIVATGTMQKNRTLGAYIHYMLL
jgi:hypothetical protein